MTIPNASAASVRDVLKLLNTQNIEVDDAREAEMDAVIKKFKLNATKSYESQDESSIDQAESSDENETVHEASLDLSLPPPPMLDESIQPLDTSESLESDLESHAANVQSNINSTLIVRPRSAKKKAVVRGKVRLAIWGRRSSFVHKLRRHYYYDGVNFACRYCPQPTIFQHWRGRLNHELTCSFNPNSREYYRCDECGKRYLFKGTLALHVIKHLQVPEA